MSVSRAEVDVGELATLTEPGAREFSLPANNFAFSGFVVQSEGRLRAFVNLCPHARRPLNYLPHRFLDRDKHQIVCTGHGARFDVDTGECVSGPCVGARLWKLDLEVRNGSITVIWDAGAVVRRGGNAYSELSR